MKLLDLGEDLWIPYIYLIGALPSDVTSLIAREPEEKCRDYSHIRGMLLQRFKLTAEKFRELFSRYRKLRKNLSPQKYTGSSHSIAGERMFDIFKDKGLLFQETTLAMSLADAQQTIGEALTTQDNPTHKYPFGEELDTPSIVEKMSSNTCQLREGEGESLTCVCVCAQKEKLNLLLEPFQNVFEPGGEATNILEHHINLGNSTPCRMSPVKNCPHCIKYKASNQKPSRLLQTPVPAQRFETLAIDLFGPLPESKDGSSSLRIVPPSGSNSLHYPMLQLKNVPLP
ncbi:uncharacterized protein TNCV_717421 [Trichonephila clavipes]|nr:uncharacterized protein TNCV_717421 [Trichonephila clavipes]